MGAHIILAHQKPVVLFDDSCLLCNKSVQLLLKLDQKHRFNFASLSSNLGASLLLSHQVKDDSIILFYHNKVAVKSTAILSIVKILGSPYNIFLGFYILPKFIRDWLYDFIARHRKSWFGETNTCLINDQKYSDRILS